MFMIHINIEESGGNGGVDVPLKVGSRVDAEEIRLAEETLVVGGGVSGMQAALDLAEAGYPVRLIERRPELGGLASELHSLLPWGDSPTMVVGPMISKVINHPMITTECSVELRSLVNTANGFQAEKASVQKSGQEGEEEVILEEFFDTPCVVLATGLEPFDPAPIPEFGYSRYDDVITNLELERMMVGVDHGAFTSPSGRGIERVVFVQCAGSRVRKRGLPYCSSVCCGASIKNALQIKRSLPDTEVVVLYIDIRTPGKHGEPLYREAREAGVRFIRGQPSMILEDPGEGRLKVCGENTLLKELYEIHTDLAVLSVGLQMPADIREMLNGLGVAMRGDGLPEDIPPSDPDRRQIPGLFLAGCVNDPKSVMESVTEGRAAAAQAIGYAQNRYRL